MTTAAETDRRGVTWTSSTLGTLAYTLFAVQQPGPVVDLRTQEQAKAEGIISPTGGAGIVTTPGQEDPFLRRQNVLGEISQLDL
jgi:hypothetical protein